VKADGSFKPSAHIALFLQGSNMRTAGTIVTCLMALAAPAAAQSAAPAGASSCSGCHDARIASPAIPPLKGRPAPEIVAAMEAFRNGGREATVMGRIAKGYTDDETRAIAAWFSQR
jgi:sulfide dehydrogenase cytochrome subunit